LRPGSIPTELLVVSADGQGATGFGLRALGAPRTGAAGRCNRCRNRVSTLASNPSWSLAIPRAIRQSRRRIVFSTAARSLAPNIPCSNVTHARNEGEIG